jgi:blue copper oxidase
MMGGGMGQGMGMGHGMGGMMGGGMGMMLMMAHPIHLHGQYFQILSRTYEGEDADDYATMREGLVSSGFKDTVLTLPGERIRIIKPFQDFKGAFMYHCHNLEHEDMGMMREFQIE